MDNEVKSFKRHAVRLKKGHPLYEHREKLLEFVKLLCEPVGCEIAYSEFLVSHTREVESCGIAIKSITD